MKKIKPNYDDGMWKGAPKSSFAKAKSLRINETEAEKILWGKLRNNQLRGFKFRRQHPIDLYIVDFYCHKTKLIIELDGEYHNVAEQIVKDKERTQILESHGLHVIRFANHEIQENLDEIISKISLKIDNIIDDKDSNESH